MKAIDEVRVLVVDDNRDEAESLAALIELNGYVADIVNGAEAALAKIAQFDPHCVMLDISMPGIDGVELSRQLRRAYSGELVVIAVSGLGLGGAFFTQAFENFDGFLDKPIDVARLERLLPPL